MRRRSAVAASALWLAWSLSLGSASAKAARPAALPGPDAKIDAILAQAFPPDGPGAAVIAVKDGKVLFRKAYGMANLELGVPLRPDMVFRIGSLTKQFTAAAILMLAEQGKLSLQDPIDKYLPRYPMQGHVITIEHLLTHTSGIQDVTEIPSWVPGKVGLDVTVAEILDVFQREPMREAPGTKWRYNNSGYILLGAVIEKVSGTTYDRFVTERIFRPLGMKSSFYGSNDPIIPKRVEGYTGGPGAPRNSRYISMTQPYAAGALVSTVDDLAAWDAALYGETLLKRSSLDAMWTPYKLRDGKSTGYGYGWEVSSLRGTPSLEHSGGIFGFTSHGLRLPEERIYVAVLCNTDSPKAVPGYLARKIAAIAMGKPFPERVAITLAPEVLERHVGVYRIDEETRRTVTVENGKLFTQRTGNPRIEAKPESETGFFYENSLTYFRFATDAAGRTTEMLMYPEGSEEPQRAVRISDKVDVPRAVRMDPAVYDAYVGEYELAPGTILVVTREGDRLMGQATGQSKVELVPSSETEFFVREVDARITFVRGPIDTIDGLVLRQGGRDVPAKRRK